jgi:MtN3 and saliva related transmembrane protein
MVARSGGRYDIGAACALLGGPIASERGPNVRAQRPPEDSMTDALAVIAATWGVMMALSPVLQLRRILERRSSADISIAYLGVLQVGFTLWMAYGVALGNVAIIVPNSVALVVGAATIGISLRYRNARATDGG